MRYLFNQIRERSFFCGSESASSVRSMMLDPRRTRDTVSIDNRCRKSTSLNSYYESINSCEFEIFLLGVFRNFLATRNYFMILIWYSYRYVIIYCAYAQSWWLYENMMVHCLRLVWSNRENCKLCNTSYSQINNQYQFYYKFPLNSFP